MTFSIHRYRELTRPDEGDPILTGDLPLRVVVRLARGMVETEDAQVRGRVEQGGAVQDDLSGTKVDKKIYRSEKVGSVS
jgi:hypothetical protein